MIHDCMQVIALLVLCFTTPKHNFEQNKLSHASVPLVYFF